MPGEGPGLLPSGSGSVGDSSDSAGASDGNPQRACRAARRWETDTDTHPGTRRLPARAAQRVLGRERGRGRRGPCAVGGAYGRRLVVAAQRPAVGAERDG